MNVDTGVILNTAYVNRVASVTCRFEENQQHVEDYGKNEDVDDLDEDQTTHEGLLTKGLLGILLLLN